VALSVLRSAGFVAIDLETTGLDSRRDAVVSLAAVTFADGRPMERYTTLVNPGRPIPPDSTRIHGIEDVMVESAPAVADVIGRFDALCAGRVVVGHGVAFDLAVLARARRASRRPALILPALDTMLLAAALRPGLRDYSLETVAARCAVTIVGRHTAEGDAMAAGQIVLALLEGVDERGYRTVDDLIRLQRTVVLPS
jgi:DNA polymerase-3 subunit epsilon